MPLTSEEEIPKFEKGDFISYLSPSKKVWEAGKFKTIPARYEHGHVIFQDGKFLKIKTVQGKTRIISVTQEVRKVTR